MKLREAAGEINRAKQVKVWVEIDLDHDEGGMYVKIEKTVAKEILEHCRENGIDEINATVESGILYIEAFDADEGDEGDEGDDLDGVEEEEVDEGEELAT